MPAWETLTEVLPGLGPSADDERRCGACGGRVADVGEYCADCADDVDAVPDVGPAGGGPPGAA